jgi:hypothetical protein
MGEPGKSLMPRRARREIFMLKMKREMERAAMGYTPHGRDKFITYSGDIKTTAVPATAS